MEVFSTRELVFIIYLTILAFWVIAKKSIRDSLFDLIKFALPPKLLVPFTILIFYSSIIIYILHCLSLWDLAYIKDIILWILFSGVPVCFNSINSSVEDHYFKHMITDNITFAVLAEFFIATFPFNFLIELILQPVFIALISIQIRSKYREEYRAVTNYFLSIFSLIIIGHIIIQVFKEYTQFNFIQTAITLALPLILSILYLPFAYFLALYSKYEILFLRMKSKLAHNKLTFAHIYKVILACKFSYTKICRFTKESVKEMYVSMPETNFDLIISRFKQSK
ncbi:MULTISPECIES: hypothetical protein [Abiotrophia]|uniref:hypothetical protein n=1 Tax=Abiotrophia TaxID=46123 RepID=UPI0027B8857C|nr:MULTISPECIES: hypothetical protein [Abiotrophia]